MKNKVCRFLTSGFQAEKQFHSTFDDFFDVVISDVPQGDHVNLSVTGNGVIIKNATYKNIKSDTKSTDFKFDSNAGTVTVLADMTVAYEVTGLNKGDTITVTATMYLDDKTIDTKTLNFTAN